MNEVFLTWQFCEWQRCKNRWQIVFTLPLQKICAWILSSSGERPKYNT